MNSWKTTVAGFVTAVATIFAEYLTKGTIDPAQVTNSLGLIVAFLLAKDHNVSGAST